MKSILRLLLACLALAWRSPAADLVTDGNWVESINGSDLVSGAGSDLKSQFESVSGVTSLTISNAPGAWSLRVQCAGSGGHKDVTVYVKRSSSGTGPGSISGGTAYMALTGSGAELFTGTEARSGISLQYKITGLSRRVSPATYLSSITFTVQ